MKSIFIPLLILIAGYGMAASYPISPRPLRKLIIESEFIVVAHVNDFRIQKNKNLYQDLIAVLQVNQVLQGKIMSKIIEVPFNPNLVCPAPAYFEKDTDVLVFLNKEKNKYFVHALVLWN